MLDLFNRRRLADLEARNASLEARARDQARRIAEALDMEDQAPSIVKAVNVVLFTYNDALNRIARAESNALEASKRCEKLTAAVAEQNKAWDEAQADLAYANHALDQCKTNCQALTAELEAVKAMNASLEAEHAAAVSLIAEAAAGASKVTEARDALAHCLEDAITALDKARTSLD